MSIDNLTLSAPFLAGVTYHPSRFNSSIDFGSALSATISVRRLSPALDNFCDLENSVVARRSEFLQRGRFCPSAARRRKGCVADSSYRG